MSAEFGQANGSSEDQPRAQRHHHRKTSRLALASLSLGVVGIFAPAGLLAVCFGHAAQIQIRRHRDRYRGRDVAKLGLLLGYLGLAIFAVLFLGFRNTHYFSIPKSTPRQVVKVSDPSTDPYYRAIKNRPEMSAAERENKGVLLVKALQQAETNYKNSHPATGYACVLEDLFQSGFDESLVQLSIDTGYTVSITDCTANPKGIRESYRAVATPPNSAGKLLCSDQSGVIRSSNATSNDACFESGKPLAIQ